MAHNLFDFNDGWDHKNGIQDEDDEYVDLEGQLRRERDNMMTEQWRNGELYVTKDEVPVYQSPLDPSPIVRTLDANTVILIASLKESHNYGGFRDMLLPIRGWIWTNVEDYDQAFREASIQAQNTQTRDTHGSVFNRSMKKLKTITKSKHKSKNPKLKNMEKVATLSHNDSMMSVNSTTNEMSTESAATDNDNTPHTNHHRLHTNHLHVGAKNGTNHTANAPHTPQSMVLPLEVVSSGTVDFDMDSAGGHSSLSSIVATAKLKKENGHSKSMSSGNLLSKLRIKKNGITKKLNKMQKQKSVPAEFSHSVHSMHSNQDSTNELSTSKYRRMSRNVRYNPAQICKISGPIPLCDLDGTNDDIKHDDDDDDDANVVTELEEKNDLITKITESQTVKKTIHFVRTHPSLLTLIYIGFCAFVEGLLFFDIITDMMVAIALSYEYTYEFAISATLIITPYFIAWSSLFGLIDKKREIYGDNFSYRLFVNLFSFSPIGVITLMLFDVWIVFELIVIRPLYFCGRFKLFRADTFEELGYRKLRRVSEVCSETVFQAFVQLYLLIVLRGKASNLGSDVDGVGGIDAFDVGLSLLASVFVIFLWFGIILRVECSMNGLSLLEYLPIVLQGSFKFVPFLPAIEKGTKNGKKVNWCLFKFDLNSLSALGKALTSPNCDLQTVKVTTKTFKRVNRAGCKYFGRLMKTALCHPVQVIVSRLESDLEEMFSDFDVDNDRNFDFSDFCRASLALRQLDEEVLTYKQISSIFWELTSAKAGNSDEQKVWLLDLFVKFRTSKERISLLDIEQPIDHCVRINNVKLLTVCTAMGFKTPNFEKNVIMCVTQNKLDIVHALCEEIGVPIVIEITEGMDLLLAYMDFHGKEISSNGNLKMTELNLNNLRKSNYQIVQDYHSLNKKRKQANNPESEVIGDDYEDFDPSQTPTVSSYDTHQKMFPLLDSVFKDVSICVAVTVCDTEATTTSTEETVHQFWNERLLFVVPFSKIDDIVNDPTHSLVRDTTHHSRFGTNLMNEIGLENADLGMTERLEDIEALHDDTYIIDTTDGGGDGGGHNKREENETIGSNTLVHHSGLSSIILPALVGPAVDDEERVNENEHEFYLNEESKQQQKNNNNNNSLHVSFQTMDRAVSDPNSNSISNNNNSLHYTTKLKQRTSSFDPTMMSSQSSFTNRRRGRESALRDSVHLSLHFPRISSFKKGGVAPEFDRKIFIDFNLFDDSDSLLNIGISSDNGNNGNNSTRNHHHSAFPFRNTGKRTRAKSYHQSKQSVINEHTEDSDSGDSVKSENDMDCTTPKSPIMFNNNDENGEEGTFLGSCHISINIDDRDALQTYHQQIREKNIKIGRRKHEQNGKLKFKVYCNALSAYLAHGKHYGDIITKLEKMKMQKTN